MIPRTSTVQGVLLALLTGLAWGTNGVSVKLIQGFSASGLSVLMLGTCFFVTVLTFLLRGRGAQLLQPVSVSGWLILLGAILGVQFLFSMSSYQLALAPNAALFNQMTPIFVVLLTWLVLHQRIERTTLLGIALAGVGASMLVGLQHISLSSEYFLGNLMAIASSFLTAIFAITVSRRAAHVPLGVLIAWTFGVAALVAVLYGIVTPPLFNNPPLRSWVIAFLFPALFAATFGHFCYIRALQLIPPERVASLVLSSPLFTSILAYYMLSERLDSVGLAGFLLTLAGIFVVTQSTIRPQSTAVLT
ncbi:MAG TPA: DMT family transporter [Anaerolineae bacterium]